MDDKTMMFSINHVGKSDNRAVLKEIYSALEEKGYDASGQIIGYLFSEDPTYITTHKNARCLIRRVDRDELLRDMINFYVDKDGSDDSNGK